MHNSLLTYFGKALRLIEEKSGKKTLLDLLHIVRMNYIELFKTNYTKTQKITNAHKITSKKIAKNTLKTCF